jgi:hypothetical protein
MRNGSATNWAFQERLGLSAMAVLIDHMMVWDPAYFKDFWWDFEGAGNYPVVEKLADTKSSRITLKTTYSFSKPGTYFPALRVAAQRQGDAETPFARIKNLGRVRVVVK